MIRSLLSFIAGLLGTTTDPTPQPDSTGGTDCALPHDLEIRLPQPDVPEIATTAQAFGFGMENPPQDFRAQASNCTLTVRPELGEVNLRWGPGLSYEPPVASTRGGVVYELVGVHHDVDRWYAVRLGQTSGWVRGDLVILSHTCQDVNYLDDVETGASGGGGLPDGRFPPPTTARLTQGYNASRHPGLDMGADTGTVLRAATNGICIRRIDCTRCTEQRPNRQPNHLAQCPTLYDDPEWGFGWGNFVVIRHDYGDLPRPLRDKMDEQNLTGGFAYVLYAHLSRINISIGDVVRQGQVIGQTGNTGCSSAPHLHFEVRTGNDTNVDNKWAQQKRVHPNLMFVV